LGEEHLTSCQSRSEAGEKDFSAEARISPILTVPKTLLWPPPRLLVCPGMANWYLLFFCQG
jgi:hypothetical protein